MSLLSPEPMARFAWRALLLVPASLAVWWFILRQPLLAVLEPVMRAITEGWVADKIVRLARHDHLWVLTTPLSPVDNLLELAGIAVAPARFTVCFPLFWGLTLATPGTAKWRPLLVGTLALFPAVVLMILLFVQFQWGLHVNHQPAFGEKPPVPYMLALPYSAFAYYLMGIGRQLSLLVLPTLTPLLAWGILHRAFIRLVMIESLLTRLSRPAPTTPINPPAKY